MAELQVAQQQNYFKLEKLCLKIGGISLTGNENLYYKIYSYLLIYGIVVPYPFLASGDLFKHSFLVVAQVFVYVCGATMGILMIIVTIINRFKLVKLLDKLEQKPFLPNYRRGGAKEEELIGEWIAFRQKQNDVFFASAGATVVIQVTYTLVKRIQSDDYHDWKFAFGPMTVLNVTYSPNYEISWLYQNIAISAIVCNGLAITFTLCGILSFVRVQFKMLQNYLQDLVKASYGRMSEEKQTDGEIDTPIISWQFLNESLQQAVDYHTSIIEIAHDIGNVFSNTMLSIYLCTLSIFCCEVYRISLIPINDPGMAIMLIEACTVLFHAFLICLNGQLMTNESVNVAKSAYEASIVGTDIRYQKGLSLLIQRAQKPILIKAGKFIETSIITFAWIIRTAYSTYMVFRRMQDD